jgi:hypothetical protein
MLRGRTTVLVLALFLALISDSAQSQQTPQQPAPTDIQSKGPEDQRGTEQSPLIVKIAPTPKTDDDRAEEAKERERIAESERRKEKADADLVKYTAELARFTALLFYATGVLGVATFGLLVAAFFQSRDTKTSVRVARDNVKALMNAEEAHLFIAIEQETIRQQGRFL